VLEHSGAPRGSVYHHFPGGRAQLLREATDYAADFVATQIERTDSALELLGALLGTYRRQLIESDYRAGCPVVAVAIEAGERDSDLPAHAASAFTRWTDVLTAKLTADGVATGQAQELAVMTISSIEGALIVARARRSAEPLEIVHRQLRALLAAATNYGGRVDDD
jgi:AcrR family transcriptional regulator